MAGTMQAPDGPPMAADIEAAKRKGRRQLLVMGAIALGVILLLVGGRFVLTVLVPDRDVTAARACREFELQVGTWPMFSPNTSDLRRSAAAQTGKWVPLGAAMTEAATAFDEMGPLGEDDAGVRRAGAASARVQERCAEVSRGARFIAANTG